MIKKTLACAALVLGLSFAASAAGPGRLTALGFFGSFGSSTLGSTGSGLGLTAKFGSFPVLGLEYNFGDSGSLALSCDYYVIDAQGLGSLFSYYLGAGVYGGLAFGSTATADLGLRLPIGLQFWPIKKLEFLVAAVPMVKLLPSATLGLGGEFGLRVHF